MTEDNDEDWGIRFVEQDEGFSFEGFNFEDVSTEETCYYKTIKRLPDIEYEDKCAACDGFPVKEGCVYYTTKDHIDSFVGKFGLISDSPVKSLEEL